jgi:hypothetical protein
MPKYATDVSPKEHLESLRNNWLVRRTEKTSRMWHRCAAQDELKINMSSKKTRTKWSRNGRRTSFIGAWNVVGAFVRPKGMTRNS